MTAPRAAGRHGPRWWLVAAGVTLVLAAVVSFYASGDPDGLERVAEDEGFIHTATDHDLADGPLAEYEVEGVDDDRLSVGVAGLAGVAATLVLGAVLFRLVRRPDDDHADDGDDGDHRDLGLARGAAPDADAVSAGGDRPTSDVDA